MVKRRVRNILECSSHGMGRRSSGEAKGQEHSGMFFAKDGQEIEWRSDGDIPASIGS